MSYDNLLHLIVDVGCVAEQTYKFAKKKLRFREIFCLKGKGPITENRDVERHVLYKRTGDRVEHTAGVTGQT